MSVTEPQRAADVGLRYRKAHSFQARVPRTSVTGRGRVR